MDSNQALIVRLGAGIVGSDHLLLDMLPFIKFSAISRHSIKNFLIVINIFFYFGAVDLVILERKNSDFLILLLSSQTIHVMLSSYGVKEGSSYWRIFVLRRKKDRNFIARRCSRIYSQCAASTVYFISRAAHTDTNVLIFIVGKACGGATVYLIFDDHSLSSSRVRVIQTLSSRGHGWLEALLAVTILRHSNRTKLFLIWVVLHRIQCLREGQGISFGSLLWGRMLVGPGLRIVFPNQWQNSAGWRFFLFLIHLFYLIIIRTRNNYTWIR